MTATMSIEEAQANLKEVIHNLAPGEEVIITESQHPIARLVSEPRIPTKQRPQPGLGKEMISFISPDFDAPLDDMREYME